MTIVVESFATAAPGGGSTTIVCDKPSGVVSGDLLIALVGGAFASGTPDVTLSGWTRRAWRVTSTMFFAVLTKTAGGSEPASYTFDNGLSASTRRAAIMRISGADTSAPIDGTPSGNDGSGTTITGTGITTTSDNSLVCLAGNWAANSTSYTPASGSNLFTPMNRIGVSGAVQASAGSTGNKTATISNGAWIGIVFALRDATPANSSPSVALDTANAAELDTTPTVEFTGTDPDDDPITYQLQISEAADFVAAAPGDEYQPVSYSGIIHPNPDTSATTWQGNPQVDDRPGQAGILGHGGHITGIEIMFNKDQDTNGYVLVRIYEFAGTLGSTGGPINPAARADTPTPGWLAVSDPYYIDTSDSLGHVYRLITFSGANQIRLEDGVRYTFITDWIPTNRLYNNTVTFQIDGVSPTHDGNVYQDGYGSAGINNGPQSGWDMLFKVYEEKRIYTRNSNTDGGFENSVTPADTDPFNSGEKVAYTSPEIEEGTWYWRVRGKDPDGTNTFGDWSSTRSFTATAGEAGINADLNVTCENTTLSSTGETPVGGSLDKALADSSLSADGSVALIGSLDMTLDHTGLTADATLPVTGALDTALGDTSLEASGTVGSTPITADLDAVCGDTGLSADGSVAVGAALDVTLTGASLASDTALLIIGSLDAALADASLSADAAILVSGGLDAALANATLTADATLPVTSSLDAIFGDTSLEASGTIGSAAIVADLVVTCEDASLNASCTVLVGGDLDRVLADASLAASGTVSVSAVLDAQLEDAALESSVTVGYAPNGANLTAIFDDAALSAESLVLVSASLAVTLADAGLSTDGAVWVVGSLDILLEDVTLTAFGRVGQVSGIQLELGARGLDMQLDDRPRGFVLKNRDRRFHGE